MPQCSVCLHPDRETIDVELLQGNSLRSAAATGPRGDANRMRHENKEIHRAARLLASGAAVAARRGRRDGGGALSAEARSRQRALGGARDVAADAVDGGAGAGSRRALWLALGCRRLWRRGYRRAAWMAGVGLGAATATASLVAGLLGPLAIAVYAVLLSLPVWIAGWWLGRRA